MSKAKLMPVFQFDKQLKIINKKYITLLFISMVKVLGARAAGWPGKDCLTKEKVSVYEVLKVKAFCNVQKRAMILK